MGNIGTSALASSESSQPHETSDVVPVPAAVDVRAPMRARRGFVAEIPTAVYVGIQLACVLVFFSGVTPTALALLAFTFALRMFAITGVYHRYFSHRTYRTSRVMQFVLAVIGTMAVQKGPLWWASIHRLHHRDSDGPDDPHSPRRGFWYSHQGWIFDDRWEPTYEDQIRDLMKFPELVWLNRWHFIAPIALALFCYAVGGFPGVVWGFVVSTTIGWHATYSINSLAHVFGKARYETGDDSKNNWALALLTFGEGWHNNHHFHQSSARQGFYWWEIDISYYVLRALAAVGLVWDLKQPPARAYAVATGKTKPDRAVSDERARPLEVASR